MAKKYRDVLSMQLGMIERVLNEEHHMNQPMKRRASGETVVDPKTGTEFGPATIASNAPSVKTISFCQSKYSSLKITSFGTGGFIYFFQLL